MSGARHMPSSSKGFATKRMRSALGNGFPSNTVLKRPPQLSSQLTHEPLPYQHMDMGASSPSLQQEEVIYNLLRNLASGDKERMALTLMQFSVAMMSDWQVAVVTGRSKVDVTCSCASAAAAAETGASIRNEESMPDPEALETQRAAACAFFNSRWASSSRMK